MIIQGLWHFHAYVLGDVLNAQRHNGKFIGIFATEADARQAVARVKEQPGFGDHPDGFHLFPFDVDRSYWAKGFRRAGSGTDEAIAGDSSGIFGNDDALVENADDTERNFEREQAVLASKPQPDQPGEFWELSHYKIGRENAQRYEDMGYKLIGFYSTRRKVEDAIRMLRTKPGFNSYPDGFRLRWSKLGEVHWEEGFA